MKYAKRSFALDPNSAGIWYVGEEICRDRSHKNLLWVQAQRKLAKVKAEGYFTLVMLNRNCIIKTGMQGLDPDREERPQLQLWLKNHPAKQGISDEDREKRTGHLKKYQFPEKTRSAKKRVRSHFQNRFSWRKNDPTRRFHGVKMENIILGRGKGRAKDKSRLKRF